MRLLIGILGSIAALVPDRILRVFEEVAIKNPEECTTKWWVNSAIRSEGVLVTGASYTGGRPYQWMMAITGVFGVTMLIIPDLYRKIATGVLYEKPENVEWNDRFTNWVRVIGVLYVLLAVRALRKNDDNND